MLKTIRVNTKTRQVDIRENPVEESWMGGRTLIADTLLKEVNPACDPLGAENKIIFCTSMLAGSGLSTALRLSVGTKSPLTGGIKESNCGGTVAAALAKHNIKAVIFENMPEGDNWNYLFIDKEGNPSLRDATEYRGMNTYEFVEKMNEKHGAGISFIGIGQAGERQYLNASLQTTDNGTGYPCRAAGRGGTGAVLGSKKIKAIVIEKSRGTAKLDFFDKDKTNEAKRVAMETLMASPVCGLSMTGTMANVDPHAEDGTFPHRNFSGKPIAPEDLDKISISKYLQDIQNYGGKTGVACQPGCVIRCSNVYNGEDKTELTGAIEYEVIGLCGANLGIFDLQYVGKMDRMCDDLGIDTIETGAALGVAMEAGKLQFGDKEAVLAVMKEIYDDTEFGRLIAGGAKRAGEALGVRRIPQCNGQGMPAYDPRAKKGLGITFETTAMGADHTAGTTAFAFVDPFDIPINFYHSDDQQTWTAVFDSMMCMFGWYAFGFEASTRHLLLDLINGMYGLNWNDEDLKNMGLETRKKELKFNQLAGKTMDDYKLPKFFYEEKNEVSDHVYDWNDADREAYLNSLLA